MRSTGMPAAAITALASRPAAAMRMSSTVAVEAVEHQVDGLHQVVAQVGDHAAERRGDAGKARDQRASSGRSRGSARRHAARRRRRTASRRTSPDRARARSRRAGSHRPCGRRRRARSRPRHRPREAERRSDMLHDRALRGLDVERFQFAAERTLRIDAAEHHVGVGQGRPRVALTVAGRPRHRAGALRPDLQQAAAIDPGDRAAARADGGDLHHRGADDEAELDRGLGGQRPSCRPRSARRRTTCRRDRR